MKTEPCELQELQLKGRFLKIESGGPSKTTKVFSRDSKGSPWVPVPKVKKVVVTIEARCATTAEITVIVPAEEDGLKMRIEAVIVCVNYSDYLAHSLPRNLNHLDHVVVVTTPKDRATIDLCHKYGVVCVDTDVFTEWGDKFNKGRGVNMGLNYCRQDAWLLHLDADVVLPDHFRRVLGTAQLDEKNIYGADRLHVETHENWQREKDKVLQYSDGCHVVPNGAFKMCSRIVHGDYGYCPIGYFQLWHGSQHRQYAGSQALGGTAEHTDVMFALQWARERRLLLPHFFVYHLENSAVTGANWNGRTTPRFEALAEGHRKHGDDDDHHHPHHPPHPHPHPHPHPKPHPCPHPPHPHPPHPKPYKPC